MIRQCIENLEKERIKALVSDYGKEIYSLFYHTLDFFTKKEIRLHSFNILLRLIDAFLIEKIPENKTINNETKQVIEKDSTKLPTELHEYFLISIEFNLYNQKNFQGLNISPFQENCKLYLEEEKLNEIKNGEWLKLIKESNGNAGAEELILNVREIFFLFFLFN